LASFALPASCLQKKPGLASRLLKKWGYKVVKGKTLGGRSKNYFSGTDEERLNDLQSFLDDPSVNAILCGRGGYGTSRILDGINWKAFKKNPKWIVGFSDITVLHGYMQAELGISSIHGPMAGAFKQWGKQVYLLIERYP